MMDADPESAIKAFGAAMQGASIMRKPQQADDAETEAAT
jgi:hypothetical protein